MGAGSDDAVTAIAGRFSVSPRPQQVDAIRAGIARRDQLVVLPTGGGKSLCYQGPAWVHAARGEGTTVVISPLIALIDDQVARLLRLGIPAIGLHSGIRFADQRSLLARAGDAALLYVSPERAVSAGFRRWITQNRVAGLVVDEAHCIAEWGHDFRPEYARIGELRSLVPAPVAAFTATATPRVRDEIRTSLHLVEPFECVGDFIRDNLAFSVEHHRGDLARLARLVALLDEHGLGRGAVPGRAVVYASTRRRVTEVGEALRKLGFKAGWYHGGRTDGARKRAADQFDAGRHTVLVATSAFGMGIDHADVRLVVHLQAPGTLEGYYQQAGRAGRDGKDSHCILFFGPSDALIQARLRGAWPGAAAGWDALEAYAWGTGCRQAALSAWFEPLRAVPPCGGCDGCREPARVADVVVRERQDATERRRVRNTRVREAAATPVADHEREQIVAFVDSLRRPVSRSALAGGLRGSRARRLIRLQIPQNPHFGALAHLPEPALLVAIDALLTLGRLAPRGKKYPTVWLPGKPVRSGTARPRTAVGGLAAALRSFRKIEARRRRWKAYQVFPNATLQALVEVRPTEVGALFDIPGLGSKRIENFGQKILEIIAASPLSGRSPPSPA